jgi:hypothetical protein
MLVKIDTNDKYCLYRLEATSFTANLADELTSNLLKTLTEKPTNLLLDMGSVTAITKNEILTLIKVQNQYYDKDYSLIYFGFTDEVDDKIDQWGLIETLVPAYDLEDAKDLLTADIAERENDTFEEDF